MTKKKLTKFIIILNFMSENYKNKLNELKEFDGKIKIGYKPFLSKLRKKWLKMFNNISHEIY